MLVEGEMEAALSQERTVSTPATVRRMRALQFAPEPGARRVGPGDVGVHQDVRLGKYNGVSSGVPQVAALLRTERGSLVSVAQAHVQGLQGGAQPTDPAAGHESLQIGEGASPCFEHDPVAGIDHFPTSARIARYEEPGAQTNRLYDPETFDTLAEMGVPTSVDGSGALVSKSMRWVEGSQPPATDGGNDPLPEDACITARSKPFIPPREGGAAALIHMKDVEQPDFVQPQTGSAPGDRFAGMASVREDRPEPKNRSVSDMQGYAGETDVYGLLCPNPMTQAGLRVAALDEPISAEECRALMSKIGRTMDDEEFSRAWERASAAAPRGVSINAFRATLRAK